MWYNEYDIGDDYEKENSNNCNYNVTYNANTNTYSIEKW